MTESQNIEWKESWRDKYLKWICRSARQLLEDQALNQFLLKRTNITWDSISVQNTLVRKLSNDSFHIFREQAVKSGRMDEPDIQVSNVEILPKLIPIA